MLADCSSVVFAAEAELLNGPQNTVVSNDFGTRAAAPGLLDHNYSTKIQFDSDTVITIDNEGGPKIHSLYLIWDKPVCWQLGLGIGDGLSYSEQNSGFIHEYAELPQDSNQITLKIPQGSVLCEIQAYGRGELPSYVQVWQKPYEDADMLLLPTHADDEHLFFGGTMPYYAGELGMKVQVAYFTNHWLEPYRPHEQLNGLWTVGVRAYPIMSEFTDYYSGSLEHALTLFDNQRLLDYQVALIRRFKPEVILDHDVNGEYGHGVHQLNTYMMKQAIEKAADPGYKLAEPADLGCLGEVQPQDAFQVKKLYLHLWKENPVKMNWFKPLENFGGKTAFDVAKEGFAKHISQQSYFSVRTAGVHDCTAFGLYYTAVGPDSKLEDPDFFENIEKTSFSDWRPPFRIRVRHTHGN